MIVSRTFFALVSLVLTGVFSGCHRAATETTPVISLSCGAVGVELQVCKDQVKRWEQRTGYTVNIISTPNSSNDRLALYQQLLASRSDDIDLLQVDVTWAGTLGNHLIDLGAYVGDDIAEHFPALLHANQIDGRLVALPWWIGTGVLFYRKDLLDKYGESPPTTWEELTRIAQRIQDAERAAGNTGLWGYVWQGRAYEGLTCNALEWVASYNGGTFVGDDGSITVDNPRVREALSLASSWVGTISPVGVLNYDEEAARGVFQTGNAVFMRNWPYAWELAQHETSVIRGKIGMTTLPRGGPDGRRAGALGGWNLAVSRYSKHPDIAIDLALFLTSAEEQKWRALEGGYTPTRIALYDDPEIMAENPIFSQLFEPFQAAIARPSGVTGARYNHVSYDIARTVHRILAKSVTPEDGVSQLHDALAALQHRARW